MKREWTIYIDNETGEGEADVLAALEDLTTCLLRLGGVGAISPLRRGYRDERGRVHYVNEGVHFAYDSYAPGINPEPEAEKDVPVENLDEPDSAEVLDPVAVAASATGATEGGGD